MYQRLAVTITAHAWNGDKTLLAICPNNNEIHIYKKNGNDFTREHVLVGHDAVITGLDWAPKTNRILSCSQDRNAYVWTLSNGKWEPALVILRINRAATRCKWSPKEDKFAVASGAKVVSVCYFEEEHDWWVSKHIKHFKSTVLSIDWHPNNILLAATSTDKTLRVVSAFVKGLDTKDDVKTDAFGTKLPFGTLCKEIPLDSWALNAKWSPSGNQLAFTTQSSILFVLECSTQNHQLNETKTSNLPFLDLLWINENALVTVGYDCQPVLFKNSGGAFTFDRVIEGKQKTNAGTKSNLNLWKERDTRGQDKSDEQLNTLHQNTINFVQPFNKSGPNVSSFSTSGLDGGVAVWDAPN